VALQEEIDVIHRADELYWRQANPSYAAKADHYRRQDRLGEIWDELAELQDGNSAAHSYTPRKESTTLSEAPVSASSQSSEGSSNRGRGNGYLRQFRLALKRAGWGAATEAAMSRMLIWIEQRRFRGFACSECGWRFNSSGAPTGESFDEMMRNFELQRDKEFTLHICADHPRAGSTRSKDT